MELPMSKMAAELVEFVARTTELSACDGGLDAQRAAYRRMAQAFTPPRPPGVAAHELSLALDGRAVAARLYLPPDAPPAAGWPGVCYLHGGGWVFGDLDSHDFITAALAAELGAAVLAVDYRLAPEHPFPAAFDDALLAWRALQAQAPRFGLDPRRIAVAGDSAGGNLAAALCLALRDAGEPLPCGQALLYPALGGAPSLPSYREQAEAPLLSACDVAYFHDLYLPDVASHADPRAAPLAAKSLHGLPPAFVAVAECDPLRDDGVEYVRRVQAAGGTAVLHLGVGLVHGCLRARGQSAAVDRLFGALAAALAGFLAVESAPRAGHVAVG
jgi:acetyl esterase